MFIHNIMEDKVLSFLAEILKEKKGICKCQQCQMDMACYALNKLKPKYIISSRGIVHSNDSSLETQQNNADIFAVINEAVEKVSSSTRHSPQFEYKELQEKITGAQEEIFYYNFPQITGRVICSDSLLPIIDAKVWLLNNNDEKPITMVNNSWNNPVHLVDRMNGSFAFWPVPLITKDNNKEMEFQFNIKIQKNEYETLFKLVVSQITSSDKMVNIINTGNIIDLGDIHISKI